MREALTGLLRKEQQMISKCTCKNEFMDKRYGKGKRVKNETASRQGANYTLRCTVCLKEEKK